MKNIKITGLQKHELFSPCDVQRLLDDKHSLNYALKNLNRAIKDLKLDICSFVENSSARELCIEVFKVFGLVVIITPTLKILGVI